MTQSRFESVPLFSSDQCSRLSDANCPLPDWDIWTANYSLVDEPSNLFAPCVDWVTRIVVASIGRRAKLAEKIFVRSRMRSHSVEFVVQPPNAKLGRTAQKTAPAGAGAVECGCMRYWLIVGTLCRPEELCSSCFVKTMKILVSAGTETTTLLFELRFMISVSPAVPIFSATR